MLPARRLQQQGVRIGAVPVERSVVMQIRVLAFARLRELLDVAERRLELPANARVQDAWAALVQACPAIAVERSSTRVARNGRVVSFDETLADGDELALLPPVGGG